MNIKKSSGQSLVEFALTLPILLLLVMGIFDLGRGIYYYSAIQNAAHEGARYAAVNHCDDDGIIEKATSAAIGLGGGLFTVDSTPVNELDSDILDYIYVTVTYQFEPVTPLIGEFIGTDGYINLKSEARQLVEVQSICPET